MDKWTAIVEYFRKIPAAFLLALLATLALILFIPSKYASALAIDQFRDSYRIFLGPAFLLVFAFITARFYNGLEKRFASKRALKELQKNLHSLTGEEKGYLAQFIYEEKTSIYVGMDDGVMGGLRKKGITYLAAQQGNLLDGFAFNLQPWAREYLHENHQLLDGGVGRPLTPREKLHSRW